SISSPIPIDFKPSDVFYVSNGGGFAFVTKKNCIKTYLVSDDAAGCVILVLHHPKNGTMLAHIPQYTNEIAFLEKLVKKYRYPIDEKTTVSLVGGNQEPRSICTAYNLVKYCLSQGAQFNLLDVQRNPTQDGRASLAINVKTGALYFPINREDMGNYVFNYYDPN